MEVRWTLRPRGPMEAITELETCLRQSKKRPLFPTATRLLPIRVCGQTNTPLPCRNLTRKLGGAKSTKNVKTLRTGWSPQNQQHQLDKPAASHKRRKNSIIAETGAGNMACYGIACAALGLKARFTWATEDANRQSPQCFPNETAQTQRCILWKQAQKPSKTQ